VDRESFTQSEILMNPSIINGARQSHEAFEKEDEESGSYFGQGTLTLVVFIVRMDI
jgi:hypothetical protein